MTSFLSSDEAEADDIYLTPLQEIVFNKLQNIPKDEDEISTSGYIKNKVEGKNPQPLFIVIDSYQQSELEYGIEIVIRLWQGIGYEERFLYLRGQWSSSKISIGDTVFVIGDWVLSTDKYGIYENKLTCVINDKQGYFISLPHILIQGTRLSATQDCLRQSYLMDLISNKTTSEVMLKGTVFHELLEAVLNNNCPEEELSNRLNNILSMKESDLYLIGCTKEHIIQQLQPYVQQMKKIAFSLAHKLDEGPAFSIDGQTPTLYDRVMKLPPYGCETAKTEENMWSFQFGVKGIIDVILEYNGHLWPLELKSGRSSQGTNAWPAHTLQLAAYIFMMESKFGERAKRAGIIYYGTDSVSIKIEPSHNEFMHIIMRRNVLAHAIAHGTLPLAPPTNRACERCEGKYACAFLESGSSSKTNVSKNIMSYLSFEPKQQYFDFFKKWEEKLLDELYVARTSQTMIWLTSPDKRAANGRALQHLRLERNCTDHPELVAPSSNAITSSMMSVGDFVMITRHGIPPVIGRGVIIEIVDTRITLDMKESNFDLPDSLKSEEDKQEENDLCIDKWESTSTIDTCRANLMSLFTATSEEGKRLKELVVDYSKPHFSTILTHEIDPKLNYDQNHAIQTALSAQDYMLLLGMPGTGKTTAIISLIKALVERQMRVLIASYTHTAVDNICLKLKDEGVEFIRISHGQRVDSKIQNYSVDSILESCSDANEIKAVLSRYQVFASTCLGCNHSILLSEANNCLFDYCIIDEASQINVPTVLGPLALSKRFILVGDHYQLPPITRYGIGKGEEQMASLFRLLSETNPEALVTLRTQYRMNDDILKLCNILIYGMRMRMGSPSVASARLHLSSIDSIKEVDDFHKDWLRIAIQGNPSVVFYNTDPASMNEAKGKGSKLNVGESFVASIIVVALMMCGLSPSKIGVISPYRAQVTLTNRMIKTQIAAVNSIMTHGNNNIPYFSNLDDINDLLEVHTVDKFQGRDKDVIIFSAVKSNSQNRIGTHISDWQRLNVSITRAKKKFILIGSKSTLNNSPFFRKFFKIVNEETIFDLPDELPEVNIKPFMSKNAIEQKIKAEDI